MLWFENMDRCRIRFNRLPAAVELTICLDTRVELKFVDELTRSLQTWTFADPAI